MSRINRFPWPLAALLVLFLLPVIGGAALYLSGWRPATPRNHGELIEPPRTLPPGTAPHGQWVWLIPTSDGCAAACEQTLADLTRVREALGKDRERVSTRVVDTGALPTAQRADWRHALDGVAPGVLLADPFGNLMMRYREPLDARQMLRDMERLLKYSWIRPTKE